MTTLTAPLVGPDVRGYEVLAVVTAVMTVVPTGQFRWCRGLGCRSAATAVFPVLVWLAVGTLSVAAHGLGANFTGLFSLSFAYLGLTQKPASDGEAGARGGGLLPSARWGGWTTPAPLPRLLTRFSVWLLLATLIAELVRRQLILVTKLRHVARLTHDRVWAIAATLMTGWR